MATDVPVSVWRPTNGNGEASSGGGVDLVTLDGTHLVTLDGLQLITLQGTYTPLPDTEWDPDYEPVPETRWQPQNGIGEAVSTGVFDIADPSGDLLVDTIGDQVVDTGEALNPLPQSEWIENDGV